MDILGLQIGLIINNNDPEQRGRVQVFIPHLTNTLYEGWNKEKVDISFRTLDPAFFTEEIHQRLIDVLPWAEVMMPFFGGGTGAPVAQGDSGPVVQTTPTGPPTPPQPQERPSEQTGYTSGRERNGINNPEGDQSSSEQNNRKASISSVLPEGLRVVEKSIDDGAESFNKLKPNIKEFLKKLGSLYPNVYQYNSGYRSPETNRKYGGVDNSWHLPGEALDISSKGLTKDQFNNLLFLAEQYGFNRVKMDSTHVHIDTGGKPGEWKEVGSDVNGWIKEYKSKSNRPVLINPTSQEIDNESNNAKNKERNVKRPVADNWSNSVRNAPGMSDGGAMGMFTIPNVGAKAYVMFLNNDLRVPIVLGSYQEPSNVLSSGITRSTFFGGANNDSGTSFEVNNNNGSEGDVVEEIVEVPLPEVEVPEVNPDFPTDTDVNR